MYRESNKKKGIKKESLFTRIAKSDNETLKKVQVVFEEYGIPKAKDRYDLLQKLIYLCKKEGDSVIPKLVLVHPDRKIFESYYAQIEEAKLGEAESKLKEQRSEYENKLKEQKAEYENKIKDLQVELKIHNVKHYSDDGSNESSNKSNNNLALIMGVSVVCFFSLMVLSINKKNS